MPRRGSPLALAALVLLGRAVGAQSDPVLRLDAGLATIQQPAIGTLRGRETADAALLAAFWRRPLERSTLLASGNLTYARDSLAAMQGVVALSMPWRREPRLRTDAGVAGATFSLRSAGTGGNANAFVRQHIVRETGGGWIGTAIGRTRRDAVPSETGAWDVGLWRRWRFLYGSASLGYQHSTDWLLLYTAGELEARAQADYDLVDLQLVLQARGGPHDLAVSWTRRRVFADGPASVPALQGSGTFQLTDRVALLATVGRQLADPMRGLPQADLAMAALRVSLGPQPLPVMPRAVTAEAVVLTESAVDPTADARRILEIRVEASDTAAVTVAGSFSHWDPIPLRWEAGVWIAQIPIERGTHRLGVRVGNGPWRAPRNLARVRDGFGGESGLLVVP
jgi:hypothetical protein